MVWFLFVVLSLDKTTHPRSVKMAVQLIKRHTVTGGSSVYNALDLWHFVAALPSPIDLIGKSYPNVWHLNKFGTGSSWQVEQTNTSCGAIHRRRLCLHLQLLIFDTGFSEKTRKKIHNNKNALISYHSRIYIYTVYTLFVSADPNRITKDIFVTPVKPWLV